MGSREYRIDSRTAAAGLVYVDFSFQTAGSSSPTVTYKADGTLVRGMGVATITHTATGTYLITLLDNFRWVVTKNVDIDDLTTGSSDGAYASCGPNVNEGTTLPIQFYVYTRAAAGTLTDYTGRRLSVNVVVKNSLVGV